MGGWLTKEAEKSYYKRNREEILAYHKQPLVVKRTNELRKVNHRKDPRRFMLNSARFRAKKEGLHFDLELKDIYIPDICPISEIPIKVGDGKVCENSPTLDRLDNTKGYVKGNTRVISQRANTRKGNFMLQEIKNLYDYVRGDI